ncbi:Putative Phospholipid binding protein [Rhizopus microsporus]|nr:Putative Phospholipid binding protein [Rhizopus microsporus]
MTVGGRYWILEYNVALDINLYIYKQGRNEKGEIGLFPITYTSSTPPRENIEEGMAKLRISSSHLSMSSKNIQSIVKQSLNNPALRMKPIEEWSSDQVALWLIDVGFDKRLADTFKEQEITGDILLELTLDSLKELQIDTFGKRFKIHGAITALKKETKNIKYTPSTDSRLNSPLPEKPYYNNNHTKHPYPDDDLVSDYSTVIRNSQLVNSINNSKRSSIDSTMSSSQRTISQNNNLSRNSSQISHASSVYRQDHSMQELGRRHTLNTPFSSNNMQESNSKYNFMRSSLLPSTSKLQSILPSSNMVRRSEDVPMAPELSLIPDMEGWLYKQGDKYKNWNKRWFVLKANNLFYFKSPKAIRMKGIINLKGYKIEVDSSIQPGKYCFKAHHEKERTFYFYTDQEKYMKDWVKTLMKATIERDYGTPVMSSSTIPTVSLETARRMRPRPPSTIFHPQQQKSPSSSYRHNSITSNTGLTPMEEHPEELNFQQSFSSPLSSTTGSRTPSMMSPRLRGVPMDNMSEYSFDHRTKLKDSGFTSTSGVMMISPSTTQSSSSSSTTTARKMVSPIYNASSIAPSVSFYPDEEDEDLIDPENMSVIESSRHNHLAVEDLPSSRHYQPTPENQRELLMKRKGYIDWINIHVHDPIRDLTELSTGEILLELLENLGGKEIRRCPVNLNQSVYSQMMDRMITAFEYMHQEGIDLDGGYTFRDILNGHEIKIMALLDAIKSWYDNSVTLAPSPKQNNGKKMASGGTFGEEEQNKLRSLDDTESIVI